MEEKEARTIESVADELIDLAHETRKEMPDDIGLIVIYNDGKSTTIWAEGKGRKISEGIANAVDQDSKIGIVILEGLRQAMNFKE